MSLNTIKVFAPATVANVVCGYDILGFAIDEPGDEIILTKNDFPRHQIILGKDKFKPRNRHRTLQKNASQQRNGFQRSE
ncbi:homoserine kinase [compost metagenome]